MTGSRRGLLLNRPAIFMNGRAGGFDKLRIFLCHSSGDKPAVRDLYERLRADGFEPWLDEKDLLPGYDWELEITKAVRNSHVVVVTLSKASIMTAGFRQKEIRFALDIAEEQPEGTIFIIPVRLEDCEVPLRLRRSHWVNFFNEDGYERLVSALRKRAEELEKKSRGLQTLEEADTSSTAAPDEHAGAVTLESQQEAVRPAPLVLKRYKPSTALVDAEGNVVSRYKTGKTRYYSEPAGDGVELEMVFVPGGTFTMGSPEDEPGRGDAEGPRHKVIVRSFFLGKYQVTQAQWKAVARLPKVKRNLDPDPSAFKGDDLPVERVSWKDAVEFCARLSMRTGREYRLPAEAEWEYACRAGAATPYSFGHALAKEVANFNNLYGRTLPAGGLDVANKFGLYDMHGNVYEWCGDAWHKNYQGAPGNGSVWEDAEPPAGRVCRGGSWQTNARACRSAHRKLARTSLRHAAVGFRVASTFDADARVNNADANPDGWHS